MTRYLRAVRWCLEHPRKTVASASAFFLVSLLMIHQLPLTFLASSDASTEVAVIDGPPGSSLEPTRVLAERARKLLATVPEVQSVYPAIGTGVPPGHNPPDLA